MPPEDSGTKPAGLPGVASVTRMLLTPAVEATVRADAIEPMPPSCALVAITPPATPVKAVVVPVRASVPTAPVLRSIRPALESAMGPPVRVRVDGAPSTLTLTGGPIALSNAGLIDLSTGAVGTDALTGTTTAFTGVAGGVIATNAQLGGIGSIASVLTVASTTGVDNIRVTDATPG